MSIIFLNIVNECVTLFAFFKMWTLQQFYLGYCMRCLSSTQEGFIFCTSPFVFMKGHGCLEHYRNFYFTRILLHFANSLQIILAFLGDHCGLGIGLQLILTWLNVLEYYERISKKQDGSLVGRTPQFFLGYSNHRQFFLFNAFCFYNFSPP